MIQDSALRNQVEAIVKKLDDLPQIGEPVLILWPETGRALETSIINIGCNSQAGTEIFLYTALPEARLKKEDENWICYRGLKTGEEVQVFWGKDIASQKSVIVPC